MRIGGFLKHSLIDWEGMITAVIFTRGCNFRCGYCHNPSLVLPGLFNETEDIESEEILSYLNIRKQWIDGVVISGGEPTVHPDLPEFIKLVRNAGYRIKLDTNGSNPVMLKELVSAGLVDFVAMDIKTLLKSSAYYEITGSSSLRLIQRISESVSILRTSGVQYQFRTTLVPGFHTEEIVEQLKKEFKGDPLVLQQFREGVTIEPLNDRQSFPNS